MSATNDQPVVVQEHSATDFFQSIGEKASQLNGTTATNGTNGAGHDADEDEPKVVEEIESLCMNCHEDVSALSFLHPHAPSRTSC